MSQHPDQKPQPAAEDEFPTPQLTEAQSKRLKTPMVSMLITMVVLTLGLAALWSLNPEPDVTFTRDENVEAAASFTADIAEFAPVTPDVPQGWTANYARWESVGSHNVDAWQVGYTTPEVQFFGFAQTNNATSDWIAFETDQAPMTGTETIQDLTFDVYEQGERRYYVLTAEENSIDGTTLVVTTDTNQEEGDAGLAAIISRLGEDPPAVDQSEVLDPSDVDPSEINSDELGVSETSPAEVDSP